MEGKKVLVTGASGFVGSALTMELCQHNYVYGLARFRDAGVRQQLEQAGVTIIQKDVHREGLDDLPKDFDYVFSELVILRDAEKNPLETHDVNTYFVGRLMDCCRDASGIILASTGAVYQPGPSPQDENGPIAPRSTYAISKFGGEVLGRFLCEKWHIPTCILRYYYPYGPTGGMVNRLARQIANGEEITFNPKAEPLYNPIYISDCVHYTIEAARLCSVSARVINIAGTEVLRLTEIASLIGQALKKEPKYRPTEDIPFYYVGDVALMERLMGPPGVTIHQGIAKIAAAELGRI